MKNAVKWLFTHEPAILGGLFAGAAVFLSIRYGAHASAVVQGLGGGSVTLAFGVLRNFVTSPAGRQSLDVAQSDLEGLPALVENVQHALSLIRGTTATLHPMAPAPVIQPATHVADPDAGEDPLAALTALVGAPSLPGGPVTPGDADAAVHLTATP